MPYFTPLSFHHLRQALSAKLWWAVIAALLMCQVLGQFHRIRHLSQSDQIALSSSKESLSGDSSSMQLHHCVLFDALSLTHGLKSLTFTLACLEQHRGLASFEMLEVLRAHPPCFFQPRAPPHFA
ncbi:MAG: hypothetical protein WCL48_03160 [Betaproteobacteria bacterium]